MSWWLKILRTSSTTSEFLALLAILALAVFLRFAYPGVNSFAGDEAHISLDALRMARGGEFVMAGQPSSVAIPFFPASVWLFALPYALSPDPLAATWFVSGISLLAVVGVWALARRWNARAGLLAALYLAASPYAVFYGRSVWQPNLLAPLACVWAISASVGGTRHDRRGKFGIGACVFLGLFVFQVHFAGIALIPATAYLFLRFGWWRRGRIAPALLGGTLAGLAALPYVYYVTVVEPDVLTRYGQVLGSATVDVQGAENLLRLALAWDWAFLGMGDGDTLSRNVIIAIVTGGLAGLGLVAILIELTRGLVGIRSIVPLRHFQGEVAVVEHEISSRPKPAPTSPDNRRILAEITLLLLVISPLTFLRHSSPVLIHYQLITLPAIALLVGAGTTLLPHRVWRIGVTGAITALAVFWSLQINQTLEWTAVNRPPNSALSSILRESRDAAYEPEPPILFFTHGDNPAIDGEAAVFKALLWTRDYRILNGDNLLVLPPYPATLLATLAPFQAWEEIEAAGLALDVQTYPRRAGADSFVATRYDGENDLQGWGFTSVTPIAFADGTTLLGWKVRRVGPRLRVSTLWRVDGEAAQGTYQQFHHLRGADAGEPLAISDVALSRATWQVSDRVIVMADFFDVAAGTAHLTVDIGHYTLDNMARVGRGDGGDPLVTLGPFAAP